jgi:4a-hydroxytetrahydrobiopterin dehydratase
MSESPARYNAAKVAKLTDTELSSAVAKLPGWSVKNGKLHRDYKFPDFAHALGFMATAAPSIEKNNHHPEWANVYNKVAVDLTTHDAGGITQKDVDLAVLLESIAKKLA